jgi:hypothetical protein
VKVSCTSAATPSQLDCRYCPASACRVPLARSLARAARLLGREAACPEPPRPPVAGVDETRPGRRSYAVRPLGEIPQHRTPPPGPPPAAPPVSGRLEVTNLGTLLDVLA